jgi:hypothetical protein
MPFIKLAGVPSSGKYSQIGGEKVESFCNTPFHAKAMELMAAEHEIRATLREIPIGSLDKKDSDARQKQYRKLDKFSADWLRLEADVLRWRAKKLREDDSLQKSFYDGNADAYKEVSGNIFEMSGTKFELKLLNLMSKYNAVAAEIIRYNVKSDADVTESSSSLEKKKDKILADMYDVRADFLKDKAEKRKKDISKSAGEHVDLEYAISLLKSSRGSDFKEVVDVDYDRHRVSSGFMPVNDVHESHPFTRMKKSEKLLKKVSIGNSIDDLERSLKKLRS